MSEVKFPINVTEITCDHLSTEANLLFGGKVGDLVKVRPCDDKYKNKTYLGFLLGNAPIATSISHEPKDGKMKIHFRKNPAIFVPALKEIIFGMGSWWSVIKDESELAEITDEEIDNIWYVKALRNMNKGDKDGG